jgi:hypothetical protein
MLNSTPAIAEEILVGAMGIPQGAREPKQSTECTYTNHEKPILTTLTAFDKVSILFIKTFTNIMSAWNLFC